MRDSPGAIIFDGDDTLWVTQPLYDAAKERFYDLLEAEGWERATVQDALAEVDLENAGRLGYSRERFPGSMAFTYEYLCSRFAHEPDRDVLARAWTIGNSVFSSKAELVPDAEAVLARLGEFYRLVLCTAGDPEVQRERIEASGLEPWFSASYIVPRKTEETVDAILAAEGLTAESTWMVGNSLRSDINPAVRLGMKCVWLDTHTWAYEHEELLAGRVWRVGRLAEAVETILAQDHLHPVGGGPQLQRVRRNLRSAS